MTEYDESIDGAKARRLLIELQKDTDTEAAHGQADYILCALLCNIGYADIVKEYDKIKKWYA